MNEIASQELSAQRAEVQVAALVAEPLDGALELRALQMHQRAEPACDADVAGGKYIEPAEPAQQNQASAPTADARQLAEKSARLLAAHVDETLLGDLTRDDRARGAAKRLGL